MILIYYCHFLDFNEPHRSLKNRHKGNTLRWPRPIKQQRWHPPMTNECAIRGAGQSTQQRAICSSGSTSAPSTQSSRRWPNITGTSFGQADLWTKNTEQTWERYVQRTPQYGVHNMTARDNYNIYIWNYMSCYDLEKPVSHLIHFYF